MNKIRLIYGLIAILGMFMPIVGIVIGAVRYSKTKDKVKELVHEEYKLGQEKGGIASLYYKHEGRRVFQKTFGMPILITFILGLLLLLIGFSGL